MAVFMMRFQSYEFVLVTTRAQLLGYLAAALLVERVGGIRPRLVA
jgi:hypothetical protein